MIIESTKTLKWQPHNGQCRQGSLPPRNKVKVKIEYFIESKYLFPALEPV